MAGARDSALSTAILLTFLYYCPVKIEGGIVVAGWVVAALWITASIIMDERRRKTMAERTRIEDFNELASTALTALSHALEDGEKAGHTIGEWLTESMTHQLMRAENHIDDFRVLGDLVDLEHAICRLTMLLALRMRDDK